MRFQSRLRSAIRSQNDLLQQNPPDPFGEQEEDGGVDLHMKFQDPVEQNESYAGSR
jgi:hypothetical protein